MACRSCQRNHLLDSRSHVSTLHLVLLYQWLSLIAVVLGSSIPSTSTLAEEEKSSLLRAV